MGVRVLFAVPLSRTAISIGWRSNNPVAIRISHRRVDYCLRERKGNQTGDEVEAKKDPDAGSLSYKGAVILSASVDVARCSFTWSLINLLLSNIIFPQFISQTLKASHE